MAKIGLDTWARVFQSQGGISGPFLASWGITFMCTHPHGNTYTHKLKKKRKKIFFFFKMAKINSFARMANVYLQLVRKYIT